MLMYSEKYCDAITVTVIAATEPVVTLALALLIPGASGNKELFSASSLLGAVMITIGAVVAGTDFLSARKDRAGVANGMPADAVSEISGTYHEASPAAAFTRPADRRLLLRVFLALMIGFALLGVSINVIFDVFIVLIRIDSFQKHFPR